MIKRICAMFLVGVMFACLFTGCQVEVATPSVPSLTDVLGETEADTATVNGKIAGTWVVGGVTLDGKIYDISQKQELESIYKSTVLTLEADGTFTYFNFLTYTGNYCWQDEETILLYADTVYNIDETVADDIKNCVFMATVLDDTTLRWDDYDPIMGKVQHQYSDDPYYFERVATESQYVLDNCTPLN